MSTGRYQEALDFAARFEPTVAPPLGLDDIDQATGLLEQAAMAIDMADSATGRRSS